MAVHIEILEKNLIKTRSIDGSGAYNIALETQFKMGMMALAATEFIISSMANDRTHIFDDITNSRRSVHRVRKEHIKRTHTCNRDDDLDSAEDRERDPHENRCRGFRVGVLLVRHARLKSSPKLIMEIHSRNLREKCTEISIRLGILQRRLRPHGIRYIE